MLSITIHDNAEMLRLQLRGELAGAWVRELEWCWRTASSTLRGRRLQLDLREMTQVDPAGNDLLAQLNASGAEFVEAPGSAHRTNWLQKVAHFAAYPLAAKRL